VQKLVHNIDDLQWVLEGSKPKNIFLVTGRHSYVQSGAETLLKPLLLKHNVIHFNQVTPNPDINTVAQAVSVYRQGNFDLVLAVGGGSVIDVAKAVRILSSQDGSLKELVRSNTVTKNPQGMLIAIPTTAGSGSESTYFAVVYINKKKYSIAHKQALPDIVVRAKINA
jgi:alcohol dehydrogenase class IV